jgi:allantoate deiminase
MYRANACVAEWMREAGLDVREDRTGNLIGRVEAVTTARRPQTLLLGSHLDTVRNAGRFDGALGVLLPIAALRDLRRRGIALPFAVEVLGFSEEEGVRFASAYLGSKGYTGQLRFRDLALRDAEGVSIREALTRHDGGRFALPPPAHRPGDLLGYVEVHIEQGPVLEAEGLAVGVVSEIAGQTRGRFTFRGKAGHAGTTPMTLRRDALAGAAELILAIEQVARSHSSRRLGRFPCSRARPT